MQALESPPASRRAQRVTAALIVLLALAVCFLVYRVNFLTQQVASLRADIDSLESRAISFESKVNYIVPIAENANKWAHCHPDILGLGCY